MTFGLEVVGPSGTLVLNENYSCYRVHSSGSVAVVDIGLGNYGVFPLPSAAIGRDVAYRPAVGNGLIVGAPVMNDGTDYYFPNTKVCYGLGVMEYLLLDFVASTPSGNGLAVFNAQGNATFNSSDQLFIVRESATHTVNSLSSPDLVYAPATTNPYVLGMCAGLGTCIRLSPGRDYELLKGISRPDANTFRFESTYAVDGYGDYVTLWPGYGHTVSATTYILGEVV